jgi:hypothetical protein
MAKKVRSALSELLSSIRGMAICAVAAYGLFREMPYPILLFRLLALWGILALASILTETLFQFLSYRAQAISAERGEPQAAPTEGVTPS